MRAFMLRGQGAGVLHDRVFLTYPTDDDFRAALARELEAHGVVFDKARGADGIERVVGGHARERWVCIVETTVVAGDATDAPLPAEPRLKMVGKLDDADVARLVAAANKAPPGSAMAAADVVVARGVGRVVNPGEPEHMAISAKDVGKLKI